MNDINDEEFHPCAKIHFYLFSLLFPSLWFDVSAQWICFSLQLGASIADFHLIRAKRDVDAADITCGFTFVSTSVN